MRPYLAAAVVAATFAAIPGASATPFGAAAGVHQGPAKATMIEQVRTVCRLDPATNRRVCVIDRSQPPTVCHWVRDANGNLVRDCY